jgi:hypothetical protein
MIDSLEAEFAPRNHEVFQLTPPEFHTRASGFYNSLSRPPVTFDTFWSVYHQLLECFRKADDDALMPVIDAYFSTIRRVDEDEIQLLPGQEELRVGGKVIGGENDGDIYVADITDSSEASDEENRSGDEDLYASFSD